ncbi:MULTISPECIES: ribosome biogenesis factor YjgA [unclassified Moraxella]|uniref:ribosome biogenesis factor YjgA n=1 Tax=unclassified Moraxella TaxID=2685852 RepID=UPI003AF4BBAF
MINFAEMDMVVSRTEQKKARERLQLLAEPLANLSKKQMKNLPASEFFMDDLLQLNDITSYEARKRHIKRLGKLLAEEEPHAIVEYLFRATFSPEQQAKIESWQTRLNLQDENTLKQFTKQFFNSEFNTVKQLLIWIAYADHTQDDELMQESVDDLHTYIRQVAILSKGK